MAEETAEVHSLRGPQLQPGHSLIRSPSHHVNLSKLRRKQKKTTSVKNGSNAGGGRISHLMQLNTAKAISECATHPKRNEIRDMLEAYNKGWITDDKFGEILKESLFG